MEDDLDMMEDDLNRMEDYLDMMEDSQSRPFLYINEGSLNQCIVLNWLKMIKGA